MTSRVVAVVAAIVVVAVIAVSGFSSGATPVASTRSPSVIRSAGGTGLDYGPVPAALAGFYRPPDPLPAGGSGTLYKAQRITAPQFDGVAYRVMYASRSMQNRIVAVTGIVIVPDRVAPKAGYPVVSWAHGTNGLGDQCAPSLHPEISTFDANALLDRGWEVTATDYAGEGTPGVLPYLSGLSSSRSTIDIVRAARHLKGAHASERYVVWGYSEGGQSAMFALDIAPTYAPELHLAGDVAGAPPSQFDHVYSVLTNNGDGYFLVMIAIGLNAAYGTAAAPLDQILTPAGLGLVPTLERLCLGYLVPQSLEGASIAHTVKVDPFTIPAWRKLLSSNDPQNLTHTNTTPLLLIQGGADTLILPSATRALATHECALGQNVAMWTYPRATHPWALVVSANDVVRWISDRFAATQSTKAYAPTSSNGVQTMHCSKRT